MNEQLKILEMVEKGQITAAEGMELLNALNASKEAEEISELEPLVQPLKRKYKFLRVKVSSDNNKINVNINVPVRLLSTIGSIADKMTTIIPNDARVEMESKGIDISSMDFAQIIEDILSGVVDDPTIVDVEAWDAGNNTMVRVKVYVD